ncbi:MAG: SDR family NAD(P)-dependent oxidoreductase, partial [Burkholderiaceae bacterium]
MKTILVTGAAGFIGHFVSERLLSLGYRVIGVDNLNDYYDPHLKADRVKRLNTLDQGRNFELIKADLQDRKAIESVFAAHALNGVIHLAAQAG